MWKVRRVGGRYASSAKAETVLGSVLCTRSKNVSAWTQESEALDKPYGVRSRSRHSHEPTTEEVVLRHCLRGNDGRWEMGGGRWQITGATRLLAEGVADGWKERGVGDRAALFCGELLTLHMPTSTEYS